MEIEERIESDEVNLTVEEDIKIYKFNEEDVNEDDADAIETAPPVSDSPGKIISGKATEKIQLNEFEENQNNHDENEEDNNENVDEQMDIEEEENQDDNVADENPEIEEQSSVKEEVINDNVADESQSQDEKEEDEDEEERENVSLNPVAIDTESRQSSEISVPKTPMKRKLSEDTLSSVLTENDENIDFLGFDENTGEAKLKMRFKSMKIEDEIDDDKSEQQENKNNHSDVEMDAEKSGYSKKTEDMKEKNFDVIDSKISKKISSEKRNFSSPRASPRSLENVAEEKINNSPRREPMNRQEIKTPPSVQIVAKSTTETIQDSPASSPRLQIDEGKFSKGSTPSAGGKQKSLKDPLFRKPFEAGWKREFVYRAVPGISKEKGEVYYITPGGKKLRTRNEILQNLTPGLTLDNFTFAKEPLGAKPEEEIIRYAKPTTKNAPSAAAAAAAAAASLETVGKRIPKPKAPKGASPPPQGWTPAKAVKHSSISTQSSRNSQSNRADENESKSMGRSTKTGKTTKKNSSFSGDTTLHSGDDSFNRKKSSRSKVATNLNSSISSSPQALIRSVSSENFASNFFGIVSVGYDVMFQVFQYLTVQELLRAARVCRVWYDVAHHRSLWRTVRMKNSQVDDWKGLAEALVRHETKHLDLRKILMASSNMEDIWKSFSKNIKIVHALEGIELCKCSSKVVSNLFSSNPKLRVLNALSIKDEFINLENISRLQNLEELRLKSLEGITLDGNLHPLSTIKTLKHLGLTSFKKLSVEEVTVIGEMTQLESLELGDCKGFDAKFATEVLGNLSNLKRLRLECGQNDCGTFDILTVISEKLTKLTQLELVNFDIKPGFDEKLSNCINIQRLLIIPTYISQSGATNNIVLSAVLHLKDTLKYLTWAVTLELLKVTALYLDQYDNTVIKDKKYFDESIPVLKPVPGISDDREKIALNTINNETQIEILPLTIIENILKCGLPSTKFKIVKVPYHATWRQNLE